MKEREDRRDRERKRRGQGDKVEKRGREEESKEEGDRYEEEVKTTLRSFKLSSSY